MPKLNRGTGCQLTLNPRWKRSPSKYLPQLVLILPESLRRRPKMLVGKPGLDGHSNGAEQVTLRARECGIEVIYEGIRFTPAELAQAALTGAVHAVGLSILSGSHVSLVRDVVNGLKAHGLDQVPVVVGGIIPEEDGHVLRQLGVARIYTPKDYRLTAIVAEIVKLVDERTRPELSQRGRDAIA
jgi:ethylmalonyl-CoA mutase